MQKMLNRQWRHLLRLKPDIGDFPKLSKLSKMIVL